MRPVLHLVALASVCLLSIGPSLVAQPQLAIQGGPYFDGDLTLHIIDSASAGQVPLLALGLNPLVTPVSTGKGPYYIGILVSVLGLAPIPTSGRLDMAITMPPFDASVVGIPIVTQAFVNGQLSNPATVPFDVPYYLSSQVQVISSPAPSVKASFGSLVLAGDLNGDAVVDLVVGAWFEQIGNFEKAGRVYVFWGPDYQTSTTLSPTIPKTAGVFGQSLAIAEVTGDGVDDLVVGETGGCPVLPGATGTVYVFAGGQPFSSTAAFEIDSPGTGLTYTSWASGIAVADFDNDSFTDIAVSNSRADVGPLKLAGRIDVFHGPTFAVRTELLSPNPEANDGFAVRLASGDVDGDGVQDLIEASCGDDEGGISNVGSIHVFRGPTLGLLLTIPNPNPQGTQSCFGTWLFAADIDADGMTDLLANDFLGNVYFYLGSDLSSVQVIQKPPTAEPNPFGDFSWGDALGSADVNQDGLIDILIGDRFGGELSGCSLTPGGAVYCALGPYFATFHRLPDSPAACDGFFGASVVAVDLDGDGRVEVITGDTSADDLDLFNSGHISIHWP